MRLMVLATFLAGLVTPPDLGGQIDLGRQIDERRWPMVGIGTRVKVGVVDRIPGVPDRMPSSRFPTSVQRLQGTVRAIAAETLYVDLSNTTGRVAIPRVMIEGVEMSLGRTSRARSAFEAATAAGLLFALFLPSFVVDPDSRWFSSDGRAASAGAVIGLGVGTVFGFLWPYERWRIAWIPE